VPGTSKDPDFPKAPELLGVPGTSKDPDFPMAPESFESPEFLRYFELFDGQLGSFGSLSPSPPNRDSPEPLRPLDLPGDAIAPETPRLVAPRGVEPTNEESSDSTVVKVKTKGRLKWLNKVG
jgi:hypothetical protein